MRLAAVRDVMKDLSKNKIYQDLKIRKILVRYFEVYRLDNSLRITVGLPNENRALIDALDEII